MAKNVFVITDKVYDTLKSQVSFNKLITLFAVITVVYIVKSEEKIKGLKCEIGRLTNQKGE
jgi:hypothetical protein